jgi:RecJ-like exonuclease
MKKLFQLKEEELKLDSSIEIFGKVEMRREKLEIQIISIKRSNIDFGKIIELKSKPLRDTFSIDSERYESMKERFIEIAHRIRLAIIEQQPILLRHHNDADGICAGLAIEEAILNVMERKNIDPKNLLRRRASPSPFYDQVDLFRDISKFERFTEVFGDASPLVVLLDTGSTPENYFALQVLDSFEYECMIIDHHNPGKLIEGKSSVCKLLSHHLNPYLFGWDSQTCGGMLAYELARFIDENYEQKTLSCCSRFSR